MAVDCRVAQNYQQERVRILAKPRKPTADNVAPSAHLRTVSRESPPQQENNRATLTEGSSGPFDAAGALFGAIFELHVQRSVAKISELLLKFAEEP